MAKKKMTFEQSLERLEEIISKMEDTTTSLDDSVALYKEGIELSLFCNQSLETAEKEITVLQQSANEISQKPFEAI